MKNSKRLQKLFAMLLVAVMVVSVLPAGTISVFATVGEFAGGDGTAENPYLIANKTQLNNVRNYLDAHFKMIADIEFDDSDFEEGGDFYNDGAGFAPIGTDNSASFTGTFDGDGYVIKNLYVNIETNSVYAGLFDYNNGTIKNLGMVDGSVSASSSSSSSYAYAGGIAGDNRGTITNCYNTGSVSASPSPSDAFAGGIAGFNYGGTITNCYNTGDVSASHDAGGIAGGNTGTIQDCYNTGSVSAYSSSYDASVNAGGIAGLNFSGTITNCYNTGNVSASSSFSAVAGGIAGSNGRTIENCYYLDNISKGVGKGTDTAIKCTEEELKKQDTFVGFDFETVWTMDNDSDYPFPILMAKLEADDENATAEFSGGDGTAENPYLIASKTQLNNVRNYLDAHFKLIADIEFDDSDFEEDGDFYNDGAGFAPIGTDDSAPFTGTFDGDGYVIKNLYINIETDSTVYAALFGYNKGTIKNLGIVDGSVSASSSSSTSSASAYAGGIAGFNDNGTILNCYNTGSVSVFSCYATVYAGGIAGVNYYYATIINCYNTGSVSASSYYYAYAGGIASVNEIGTITNCYNTGSVSASSSYAYAGGIAGYILFGTIENCYNTGDVSASHDAGGIAGFNDEGTVKNCYYLDNISKGVGNGTDTATKCTDEQLKNQETFKGFDFDTVWTIENNTNYPYPVLKDNPMILIGMGDINSDGKLDSTDYLLIKRAAFGTYTFTEAMTLAGDINGDVKIDSADYLLVKRACFGTYKI